MADRSCPTSLPWLLGALLVVLATWPWPLSPGWVLGAPDLEADNHLWMLWRSTRWLLGDHRALGAWPDGFDKPLMDLPHLPVFLLASPLGWGFAYSFCFAVDVALAAAGGYLLAREVGASRWAALVGMTVCASMPSMSGLLSFGISEGWSVGAYALYLTAALRLSRRGRLGDHVAASLVLAGFALTGWYHALFAALASPLVVLWGRAHGPHWRRLLFTGALSVLLVLPVLVLFVQGGWAAELASRAPEGFTRQADWLHQPQWGIDPVALLWPSLPSVPLSRTGYLGLSTVLLAIVGAARLKHARWALLGAAWMALWAMGHHLTVAGQPLPGGSPASLPAAWLSAVLPLLYGLANWYRAAGMASVFLAAAAALGAEVLRRRLGWPAVLVLAALVWADQTLLCDAPWPRQTYASAAPDELVAVPGNGPLMLLPFDNGARLWPRRVPRAYQRWQVHLGRPITEHYEGVDPLLEVPVVAWVDRRCHGSRPVQDVWASTVTVPDTAPTVSSGRQQWTELAAEGLTHVAIVLPRAESPTRCRQELERYLGPPDGTGEVVLWWALD